MRLLDYNINVNVQPTLPIRENRFIAEDYLGEDETNWEFFTLDAVQMAEYECKNAVIDSEFFSWMAELLINSDEFHDGISLDADKTDDLVNSDTFILMIIKGQIDGFIFVVEEISRRWACKEMGEDYENLF